jgi:hypothetical protein
MQIFCRGSVKAMVNLAGIVLFDSETGDGQRLALCEMHLRRILRSYARYYNEIRTHRSLDKGAPVTRPVQRVGVISSRAVLGGLHNHYARA